MYRNLIKTSLMLALAALLVAPAATSWAKPGKNKIQTWMMNTGADPDAKGLAKMFLNGKRERFSLKVKNLDVGTYDVDQDGAIVGSFDVTESDDGKTRGQIKWDAKKGNPLVFDPRGSLIGVSGNGTTYLTALFPADQTDVMNVEFEANLINMGVLVDAEGEADFRLHKGRMRFDVEIEDVPEGDYTLRVDGTDVAVITATMRSDGSIEGKVKFSSFPKDEGSKWLLLTFDPRGKLIEVVDSGDMVILSVAFPTAPPAP